MAPPPSHHVPPGNGGGSAAGIPLRSVFWVTVVVLISAIITVIAQVFRPSTPDPSRYGYTVALLCFALSTLSALLFATKSNLKATVGIGTITVAGPAALWIIALLVFVKVFPYRDPQLRLQPLLPGWSSFEDWKQQIGAVRRVFEEDEESNTRYLMSAVYSAGRERKKLDNPVIETLFVYPKNPVESGSKLIRFKLQRISGKAVGSAYVFLAAASTGAGGGATSFFFSRGPYGAVHIEPLQSANWHKLDPGDVDAMMVTRYEEKEDLLGDWLQIQTAKFVAENDTARVIVGLSAAPWMKVKTKNLWEFQNTSLPEPGVVPMQFRRTPLTESAYSQEFLKWLDDLEKEGQKGGPSGEFLRQLPAAVKTGATRWRWRDLLEKHNFPTQVHYLLPKQKNPVLLTFEMDVN